MYNEESSKTFSGSLPQGIEIEPEVCTFCEIVGGRIPSSNVAETEKSISFMSLEGHPLVVSKKHVGEDLQEDQDSVIDVLKLAFDLVPFVREVYQVTGISIITNIGKSAGQEVAHFHTHVIPRKLGDGKVRINLPILDGNEIKARAGKLRSRISAR